MKKQFQVMLVLLFVSATTIMATPIIGAPGLWTDALAGWNVVNTGYSNPGAGASETGSGTTAGILFTGGGLAPAAQLYATSGNFVGDLRGTADLAVTFRFTSDEVPPNQGFGSLAMFFTASSGGVWYYDLTPPSTVGSFVYAVGLGGQGNWYRTAGATDFWTDLGLVTQFGFELLGANYLSDQNYHFSDVTFTIPEPETVWMLLVVVASLGITFRHRLTEVAAQVKARLQG